MTTKWFFDSNTIADWLLNKLTLEEKESFDEAVDYLKELKKIRQDSLYAFLCIDTIHYNDKMPDFEFFTSSFAISEVVSVIYDKYATDELYKKRIPLKYWYKVRFTIDIPDEILRKLSSEIIKFHMLLISRKKIRLLDNLIIQNTIELITKLKCETHDAYLLSQSLFPPKKCDYFVTTDGRLKESVRDSIGIEVVKPAELYNKLKKVTSIQLNFKNLI